MNRDRKNYLAHSLEGGLFIGGMSFIAGQTVLTVMAKELGASNWVISILPIAMFMGLIMAPIFTASFIERSRHMKRISMITGVPQRLVFLVAGLVIIFWGEERPGLALTALVLAPILSGAFGGIGHGAWMQLVARTVPANRRSSLSATRNLIAATISIFAGIAVERILSAYDGVFGFGLLHLIAFAFLVLSYLFFTQIEENVVEPIEIKRSRSLPEYFNELVTILREDRDFRFFAIMRVTGPFNQFVVPYMTIYAIDVLDASASFAGSALIASTVGQFVGNAIGGVLGDRLGGKMLLVIARVSFLLSFVCATMAQTYLAFMLFFFTTMLAASINGIGNMTLMLEIAPDHRRPTYGALAGLLNGPSMIVLSLVGSMYWTSFNSMQLQAMIASCGMIVSTYAICKVREPRRNKLTL